MSATPRTDEFHSVQHTSSDSKGFARQLETELTAANAALEACQKELAEAKEALGFLKTEHAILLDRLCCKKHPSDNGIMAQGEILPSELMEVAERLVSGSEFSTEREQDLADLARIKQQLEERK